jgi:hypothetical protein
MRDMFAHSEHIYWIWLEAQKACRLRRRPRWFWRGVKYYADWKFGIRA